VNGFSTIAGAFLGGIFISAFGYLWVFVVNAVSAREGDGEGNVRAERA